MNNHLSFEQWSVSMAKTLSSMLDTLEERVTEALDGGDCPYDLPDGIEPCEVVAGAVLLVFCGMLADEKPNTRGLLMRAADRIRGMKIPEADNIREAADELLDTLGAVRTRHRWN